MKNSLINILRNIASACELKIRTCPVRQREYHLDTDRCSQRNGSMSRVSHSVTKSKLWAHIRRWNFLCSYNPGMYQGWKVFEENQKELIGKYKQLKSVEIRVEIKRIKWSGKWRKPLLSDMKIWKIWEIWENWVVQIYRK